MPDPREGVDEDGFITTGADRRNLRAPFVSALSDAAERCRTRCSPGYGLYVYGSVATGQARPGVSDLDLLLVVQRSGDLARVQDVGPTLTRRYAALFREVSVATATEAEILGDSPEGRAGRCFLRHYCLCIAGRDLTVDLPPCRPSRELAAGFGAETADVLARIRRDLEGATDDQLAPLARAAARKLLLTCAAVVSAGSGGWTTDRARAATALSDRHPERAGQLQLAVRWCDPSVAVDADRRTVEAFVHDFGDWVLRTFEASTGG